MHPLFRRIMVLNLVLLLAGGALMALLLVLHSPPIAQASTRVPAPLVLAAYQAWHGLPNHLVPPPYTSTDPIVIANHIQAAQARGINGFVVNWYGPPDDPLLPNNKDRGFIDQATGELIRQAGPRDFHVALMYDEGTVSATGMPTTTYTARVISDLIYARNQYFTMTAYLSLTVGETIAPVLFVFPYDNVDPYIDWAEVRSQLGVEVVLIDKDPDLPHHDSFDGFFAWVQPSKGWDPQGNDWGEGYLTWFYNTMANATYSDKITVGGVWPGFDDILASWGSGRYIWRRCGQTWRDTWALANFYNPPIVMISTWNDFEEGTDIEYGVGECLGPSRHGAALPGGQVIYTHSITNTGKFIDTFNVTAASANAWPTATSLISVTLPGHASTPLVITVTVPLTANSCSQDILLVTTTSTLSESANSSVVDTTTALYCTIYLPIIRK